MTREEAKNLKLFQIVRYNVKTEDLDKEDCWSIPYCGKIAVVTQKIVWDDFGEEIHIMFPMKSIGKQDFYDSVDELMNDWDNGHDVRLAEGFDTGADYIDLI